MHPSPVFAGPVFADPPQASGNTMANIFTPALRAAAAAACSAVAAATAQTSTDPTTLPAVTVTARGAPSVSIGGFADLPLSKAPFQASVFGAEALKDGGVHRLADLTRFDPALSDAYNAVGYTDFLAVRGFVLDQRFNYRRDGLPINAETSIPLDNKERVEVLEGISGMQAGTSAPGGLVNYVVKRPLTDPLRSATLQWQGSGSLLGVADVSQRFGNDKAFGLRLNAAYEQLEPNVRNADGQRRGLALAGDWRIAPGTLLEAEFETSHQSQPSVPGFSLLGKRVPAPVDPRINLNNQPWSLPVMFDADTASLRFTQALSRDWRWSAHLATQRLRTDDRVAFPFGCGAEGNFDRYCSDGSFDLYDFRSENERRRSDALELALHGNAQTGMLAHALSAGVLRNRFVGRFQQQAFNYVGSGNIDASIVTPADPSLTDENTNRSEGSTELFIRDAVRLSDRFGLWLGLRHTALQRASVRTDGSRATDYSQSFTSPWLAASLELGAGQMLYASLGRGSESEVAPNRSRYTNRGTALPVLQSRQFEVGIKGERENLSWNLAAFDITRPAFADVGTCDADDTCTRQADGTARHRGLEASGALRSGPWWLQGGLQWLHARRQGSATASVNGQRPPNVPALAVKLQTHYSVAAWPGLSLGADVSHESDRTVLPDDAVLRIAGYSRAGLNGQLQQRTAAGTLTWRAAIDNLFDRRAWKESPYQFGHVYLFPLAARTARVSVQAAW